MPRKLVMPGGVDAHCHIDEAPHRGAFVSLTAIDRFLPLGQHQ